MALEKYWRPFDFTLSFPARKNDSCFAHNILNILNILNIWTFEQKLQWYLVKKFLCSARASTIPPKKTYSLSRKKSKSMSVRVHNIFTYQSQNKSKIVSVEMSIFLHNKKDLGFLCKVILLLKCCKVEKNEFSNQVVIGLKKQTY